MKWMRSLVVGLVGMVLALAGCVPERVVWSPDGSRAAVLGDDGLHVCDGAGKLSPLLVPGARAVAWLPDGKRAAVVREEQFKTWKDVLQIAPWAERSVRDLAPRVRKSLIETKGDSGAPGVAPTTLPSAPGEEISPDLLRLCVMYLRDTDGESLRKELGENFEKISGFSYEVPICQIYDLSGTEAKAGAVLMTGKTNWMLEPRPSPDGQAVLVSCWTPQGPGKGGMSVLLLSRVEFGPDDDNLFLGEGCIYPDWTPDGKSLVYVRPENSLAKVPEGKANHSAAGIVVPMDLSDARMGTLSVQTVVGKDGKLVGSSKELPPREDLAGVAYEPMSRVRVAKDGRVFFSAMELSLPATPNDLPARPTLFSIQPGKQATLTRVVPRRWEADLGDMRQFFELSPGGTHISVPSEDGEVTVLEIATGNVQSIQARKMTAGGQWKSDLESVPTWRTDTELTFVRPEAEGQKRDVWVYSLADNKEHVISAEWPAAVRKGWLEPSEAATAPSIKTGPTTGSSEPTGAATATAPGR